MENSVKNPRNSETFVYIDKIYEWYLSEECNKPDTEEVQTSWDKYEEIILGAIPDELELDAITAACSYGESRERKGFMAGFKLAFNLIREAQA